MSAQAKGLDWDEFYPAKWLGDPELRRCSAAARGVWIDLVAIMMTGKGQAYGRLCSCIASANALALQSAPTAPLTVQDLSRMTGEDPQFLAECLGELERNNVFAREDDGTICCRFLVYRGSKREARRCAAHASHISRARHATHNALAMQEQPVYVSVSSRRSSPDPDSPDARAREGNGSLEGGLDADAAEAAAVIRTRSPAPGVSDLAVRLAVSYRGNLKGAMIETGKLQRYIQGLLDSGADPKRLDAAILGCADKTAAPWVVFQGCNPNEVAPGKKRLHNTADDVARHMKTGKYAEQKKGGA